MPRTARLLLNDQKAAYHVISRTALPGFPFGDVEKDHMVKLIKQFARLYFVDILGYCLMSNHVHLLIQTHPGNQFSDDDIIKRLSEYWGKEPSKLPIVPEVIDKYRTKLSSLSMFMKDLKQNFSMFYNRLHNRVGTLWSERFKSVIVEKGETLVNCLAYIDLNPVRAGIVEKPEDYRWSSIGYHAQTGNKDGFLSMDFGMKEFGVLDEKERFRRYRRYVYEAGAIDRPGLKPAANIKEVILEKERNRDFNTSRTDRFLHRTRYFTDSGIIGGKEFVYETYQRFKHHFQSRNEKKPRKINGFNEMYSLKRLSEA